MILCDWLLSLSIMFSRLLHIVVCISIPFLSFFFSPWPQCVACGILVPQPRIEPATPEVEVQSVNHWTAREVPLLHFFLWLNHTSLYGLNTIFLIHSSVDGHLGTILYHFIIFNFFFFFPLFLLFFHIFLFSYF